MLNIIACFPLYLSERNSFCSAEIAVCHQLQLPIMSSLILSRLNEKSVLTFETGWYSGVLGLDILRLMEAKVDLCSGDLIIGRRRHELTGLDCPDRDPTQVIVMKPFVDEGREASELITPEIPARNVSTGKLGTGGPESLVRGEMNPDCSVFHDLPNNTCSILASRLVIL
jgi:hypothetical protein